MAGLFIKLDHDWMRDPKVRTFKKEAGKSGLVDLIQLYILMGRHGGRVDLSEYGNMEDAKDLLGMSEQKVVRTLDLAAECGVIDEELWRQMKVATSNRAVRDAETMRKRSEAGKAGGAASGKSRNEAKR